MNEPRLYYFPNPAHKTATTEAGPPQWHPDKTACPDDLSMEERDDLVLQSFSEGGDPLDPNRYAIRRTADGTLQWFRSLLTIRHQNGRIEIHGHPFLPGYPKVPPRVLRQMRGKGIISQAEYKRVVKT